MLIELAPESLRCAPAITLAAPETVDAPLMVADASLRCWVRSQKTVDVPVRVTVSGFTILRGVNELSVDAPASVTGAVSFVIRLGANEPPTNRLTLRRCSLWYLKAGSLEKPKPRLDYGLQDRHP